MKNRALQRAHVLFGGVLQSEISLPELPAIDSDRADWVVRVSDRPVGEGTGLGLSQVYGFAHQSGGAVSLDSAPGRGTTITIRLPRSHTPMPATRTDDNASDSAPVGARILLVEDNPQVADVTAQMLTTMGFQVEATDRARKAL